MGLTCALIFKPLGSLLKLRLVSRPNPKFGSVLDADFWPKPNCEWIWYHIMPAISLVLRPFKGLGWTCDIASILKKPITCLAERLAG